MITKEDARYLTDEEVKIVRAEYVRRTRGGKQEIKPEIPELPSQKVSPTQVTEDLNIFNP